MFFETSTTRMISVDAFDAISVDPAENLAPEEKLRVAREATTEPRTHALYGYKNEWRFVFLTGTLEECTIAYRNLQRLMQDGVAVISPIHLQRHMGQTAIRRDLGGIVNRGAL